MGELTPWLRREPRPPWKHPQPFLACGVPSSLFCIRRKCLRPHLGRLPPCPREGPRPPTPELLLGRGLFSPTRGPMLWHDWGAGFCLPLSSMILGLSPFRVTHQLPSSPASAPELPGRVGARVGPRRPCRPQPTQLSPLCSPFPRLTRQSWSWRPTSQVSLWPGAWHTCAPHLCCLPLPLTAWDPRHQTSLGIKMGSRPSKPCPGAFLFEAPGI